MYNVIEEKDRSVSKNGLGLNNGLGNKEAGDTWAALDNAIDNELNNGCSDEGSHLDKSKGIHKPNIIKSAAEKIDSNGTSSQKNSKLNSKTDSVVVDLEESDIDSSNERKDENPSLEPLDERVTDEFLTDDNVPMIDPDACKKITNGTIKINLSKNNQRPQQQNSSNDINKNNDNITQISKEANSKKTKSSYSKDKGSDKSQKSLGENRENDKKVVVNPDCFQSNTDSTKDGLLSNKEGAKHAQNTKPIKTKNEVKEEKHNPKSVTVKQDTELMDGKKSDNFKSENIKSETDSKQKFDVNGTKCKDESDDPNYETALQNLASISQYAKILDDDHAPSLNSLSSATDSVDQKKRKHAVGADEGGTTPKLSKVGENEQNKSVHEEVATNTQSATKAVKKQLKRISRNDMEDLVARKVVEVISCRSEIGELRAKCDKYEESNEKWKRKTQALQKMCQDLNTVIKRYIIDVRNKKDNPTPIKITRSVGLQVSADQKKRMPIMPVQPQQHSSGTQQPTSQGTSQHAKQAVPQKSLPPQGVQRRAGTGISGGNQPSKVSSQNNASLPQSSSTSLNKNSPKQLQNTSTVVPPATAIVTNAGAHKMNQSSPQHPLITNKSSNSQKTMSSASNPIITISPSTKGYLATQAIVVPAASSIVTATTTQNNLSSIRSSASSTATIPLQVPSSAINVIIPNNITVSKPPAVATATVPTASNGSAGATAASNKVIDLVELSDEEDVITPPPPQQLQPPKTAPAPRSQPIQQTNAARPPVANTGFQNQLPQHKPQQTINRIHAPNPSRSES